MPLADASPETYKSNLTPASEPLNCTVEFPGYGGGRGLPHECLLYAAAGYAHLFVDAFLCAFRRGADVSLTGPYPEIVSYLKVHRGRTEQVFDTLSYFDGVHFAALATAPALFSVALMDTTCPPSTVYAAFQSYRPGSIMDSRCDSLPGATVGVLVSDRRDLCTRGGHRRDGVPSQRPCSPPRRDRRH